MEYVIKIIESWKAEDLLGFLENQNLHLDDEDKVFLKKMKVSGSSFLEFTREDFCRYGLAPGPAIAISKLIKNINDGICTISLFSSVYNGRMHN